MSQSPLRREVLNPPPRRLGAVVIMMSVAATLMTVAVSLFALRMDHAVVYEAAPCPAAADDHEAAMWRLFVSSERTHDYATALYAYEQMADGGANRTSLRERRDEIASEYFAEEMARLEAELDRHECAAAQAHRAELVERVPERASELPDTLSCP